MIDILRNKFKNKDNKIVVLNIAGTFVIKGLAMVVALLTVPAFISYFDDNVYLGIWYTVLSVIMWFMTFDFGIGNGLRNKLVKSLIDDDTVETKQYISSGLFVAFSWSLAMLIIGWPIINLIDWNSVYDISSSVVPSSTLVSVTIWLFIAVLVRFTLVTISSIFYALQLSSINNLLGFLSSCLVFIFVKFTHFETPEIALRNVAIAYVVAYNLPIVVAAFVLFSKKLRKCIPSIKFIDIHKIKDLFSIGGIFFYCQILFTLLACSDQFLITKFYGAKYTVDYTFYHRLTSIIGMIVALGTTPLWSMITKAMEQNKYKWIINLFNKLCLCGLAIVVVELLFIPFLQPIMNLWLGKDSINVDYETALAFALFGSLFIMNNLLSTFACGLGKLKVQFVWYTLGLAIKLSIILMTFRYFDNWNMIIWANVFAFLPYIIIQYIELKKYFNKRKNEYGD